MNKTIRMVCLVMAIVISLTLTVNAEDGNTYSSAFIASYDSFISIPSGRTMEIWFDVVGKGEMDEIGVESIKLQRSSDGSNWTTIRTFLPENYPQMIIENTGINCDCITYTGAYGYYYRAYVAFYASNSRGWGNEYEYTPTIYIMPPAGFIP